MRAHHVPGAADKGDTLTPLLTQRVDRVNDRLLQVGAHRMKERRRGVDVDKHAVRERLIQTVEVVLRDRRWTDGHKARELVRSIDERVHGREERQAHHVLHRTLSQCLTHVGKIGILGSVRGIEVLKHRDGLRDAGARCAQRVAELVGYLDDTVAGRFLRGETGVSGEDARHRRLRVTRRLGNITEIDHRSPSQNSLCSAYSV